MWFIFNKCYRIYVFKWMLFFKVGILEEYMFMLVMILLGKIVFNKNFMIKMCDFFFYSFVWL